jgi:prepilin signal peptidase PulO-like enzyme (type II secretory pathway)
MEIVITIGLFILGAVMGSFACCQVWRLKFREHGEKLGKRSVCLECEETLRWHELIPVVSWVVQKGKCRHCGAKIGWMEIWCELGLGVLFAAAYWWWPERFGGASESPWNWAGFGMFLVLLVGLTMLFMYDLKWGKLPVAVLIFCIFCAIVEVILVKSGGFLGEMTWLGMVGGLLVLPGIYLALYVVSKEQWVGAGDWILALALAIVLGDFTLALLCLLTANLLGCVVAVPVLVQAKKKRGMRVAMGPMLIGGFLIVFFWGDTLRAWLGL